MGVRRGAGGWVTEASCGLFIDLRALTPRSGEADVLGVLRYDRADPFAVRLECHSTRQKPVVWRFARETLEAGVRGRAGAGSVLVCAGLTTSPEHVFVLLSNPEAYCVLRGRLDDFEAFLARTRQVVPYGREREHLQLETSLARLVSGPGEGSERGGRRPGPPGP
jgi:hypothetical protein